MENVDDFLNDDSLKKGIQSGTNLNANFGEKPPARVLTTLSFYGEALRFFGIIALNALLTIISLGLYYPWAKAAYRKYLWNETEFKDSRFVFNGTGLEMFKGFLVVYGFFLVLLLLGSLLPPAWILGLMGLFYLSLIVLIPFAIYGGWRYRVSRTSWRGIFFSFDGNLKEFIKLFIPQLLLTIITLGIYAPWMRVKLQKYLFSHTSIGDLKFDFHGKGVDLFVINIVGGLLSLITLYLYIPIYIKERFNFTINNTTLQDDHKRRAFVSTLENGEAWVTLIVNVLIMIVPIIALSFSSFLVMDIFSSGSLGGGSIVGSITSIITSLITFAALLLPMAFVYIRTMRMYAKNIEVPDDFDYDNLRQSDKDYRDATGDELSDVLDIGLDF